MPGNSNAWDDIIEPNLDQIAGWTRDGHTIKQICERLGTTEKTFHKYKSTHCELRDALKISREMADLTVENSLFKRANGYTYVETIIKEKRDENGTLMTSETTRIIKTVLPDTTAQIFWLKNRQPEKWRDAWKVHHEGKVDTNAKLNLSKKEVQELLSSVVKDDDC